MKQYKNNKVYQCGIWNILAGIIGAVLILVFYLLDLPPVFILVTVILLGVAELIIGILLFKNVKQMLHEVKK